MSKAKTLEMGKAFLTSAGKPESPATLEVICALYVDIKRVS